MALAAAESGLLTKAKLFRGLSDPSRLSVLESLRNGPKCVSEVVSLTGLSQSNASGHLACLRDCGLVLREAKGRFAYYHLAGPEVEGILREAEAVLAAVEALVDACPRYETSEQE